MRSLLHDGEEVIPMSSRQWISILIITFTMGVALGYGGRSGTFSTGNGSHGTSIGIEPFFCPEDHCSQVVISWISKANVSIDLAMYSFTLDSIGDALIRAHSRGVRVRVIMEREQVNRWSEYGRLRKAGIQVILDRNPAYMHDKFMVVDGKVVLTGSFNYTKHADTENDENLVIIISSRVARAYESEFEEMWEGKFGS